jgi:hypothetical protein
VFCAQWFIGRAIEADFSSPTSVFAPVLSDCLSAESQPLRLRPSDPTSLLTPSRVASCQS